MRSGNMSAIVGDKENSVGGTTKSVMKMGAARRVLVNKDGSVPAAGPIGTPAKNNHAAPSLAAPTPIAPIPSISVSLAPSTPTSTAAAGHTSNASTAAFESKILSLEEEKKSLETQLGELRTQLGARAKNEEENKLRIDSEMQRMKVEFEKACAESNMLRDRVLELETSLAQARSHAAQLEKQLEAMQKQSLHSQPQEIKKEQQMDEPEKQSEKDDDASMVQEGASEPAATSTAVDEKAEPTMIDAVAAKEETIVMAESEEPNVQQSVEEIVAPSKTSTNDDMNDSLNMSSAADAIDVDGIELDMGPIEIMQQEPKQQSQPNAHLPAVSPSRIPLPEASAEEKAFFAIEAADEETKETKDEPETNVNMTQPSLMEEKNEKVVEDAEATASNPETKKEEADQATVEASSHAHAHVHDSTVSSNTSSSSSISAFGRSALEAESLPEVFASSCSEESGMAATITTTTANVPTEQHGAVQLFSPMRDPLPTLDGGAADASPAMKQSGSKKKKRNASNTPSSSTKASLPTDVSSHAVSSSSSSSKMRRISEEFAPITAEEMEASLGTSGISMSGFGLLSPNGLASIHGSKATEAATTTIMPSAMNDSAQSLNLSMTSTHGLSSPNNISLGKIPATFLSSTPSSPAIPSMMMDHGSFALSPIEKRMDDHNVSTASSHEDSPMHCGSDPAATSTPPPPPAASSTTIPATSSHLSNSALKIQALFRGRMERARGVKGHAYGGVSVRSSKTPKTTSAMEDSDEEDCPLVSPRMKRTRLANSQQTGQSGTTQKKKNSKKNGPTMDEEAAAAAAVSASAARELNFKADDSDHEEGDTAMSLTARASSTASVTRTPSASSSTSSSSAASCSQSSSPLADLPAGPPLSPAKQRRLQSELKSCRLQLNDATIAWEVRSKAMNRIEALLRERGRNGLASWTTSSASGSGNGHGGSGSGWANELHQLQRPLSIQLADLRSSIIREVCRLLIALSEAAPREFEEQLAFYVPLLWKLLYVTVKAIASRAEETLKEIVEKTATHKCIPLFLSGLSDPHAVVREKCGQALQCIIHRSSRAEVETFLPTPLLPTLKTSMQDSDPKCRAEWRKVFEEMRRIVPEKMDSLFHELPTNVQRALESDRRSKNPSKSSSSSSHVSALAGVKRKKQMQ